MKNSTSFILLRVLIGWHFFYEGITKLYNPLWTSKGYLLSSQGIFSDLFAWLANDSIIGVVDYLNIFLLLFVGAGLVLGFLEKGATIVGMILLLMYYLSHPPFPGLDQGVTEGNYFIVNKNLIELAALWVLYFNPTSVKFGLERLFNKRRTSYE